MLYSKSTWQQDREKNCEIPPRFGNEQYEPDFRHIIKYQDFATISTTVRFLICFLAYVYAMLYTQSLIFHKTCFVCCHVLDV